MDEDNLDPFTIDSPHQATDISDRSLENDWDEDDETFEHTQNTKYISSEEKENLEPIEIFEESTATIENATESEIKEQHSSIEINISVQEEEEVKKIDSSMENEEKEIIEPAETIEQNIELSENQAEEETKEQHMSNETLVKKDQVEEEEQVEKSEITLNEAPVLPITPELDESANTTEVKMQITPRSDSSRKSTPRLASSPTQQSPKTLELSEIQALPSLDVYHIRNSSSSSSSIASPTSPVPKLSTFVTDNEKLLLYGQNDETGGNTLLLPSVYTSRELHEALRQLVDLRALPPDDMLPEVMNLCNRKRVEALYNSDYDEAARMDDAAQQILQGQDALAREKTEYYRKKEMQMRIDQLEEKYQSRKSYWDNKISADQNECDEKIFTLQRQHQLEIKQFKENWKSPDYIKQFVRPSPRLLQLRHIEKKMAIQRMYNEAKNTKRIADALQAQEEEIGNRHLEQKMQIDWKKMKNRQYSEIEKIRSHHDKIETDWKIQMKKELDIVTNAIKQVSMRKSIPLTERSIMFSPKQYQTREISQQCSTIPTPRTQQKYSNYKDDPNGKLNLSPMSRSNFSKLEKTPRAQKRRPQTSLDSRFPKL